MIEHCNLNSHLKRIGRSKEQLTSGVSFKETSTRIANKRVLNSGDQLPAHTGQQSLQRIHNNQPLRNKEDDFIKDLIETEYIRRNFC